LVNSFEFISSSSEKKSEQGSKRWIRRLEKQLAHNWITFERSWIFFPPVSTKCSTTNTSQCTYLSAIRTLLKAWQCCHTQPESW